MLIAVVGGKLQGVEIIFLAKKAGYQTLLIDKKKDALATKICDHFLHFEFSANHTSPPQCTQIDLILPAVEDDEVLAAIVAWAESANIPIAFDQKSYNLSSSKLMSDDFFKKLRLPAPRPWPSCDFPVIVKPDQESGSRGVQILRNQESFNQYIFENLQHKTTVIQEYLEGPSYSIEIIGSPGNYTPLQVTQIHMDSIYDCKRVTCPTDLPYETINAFENIAITIAEEMKLKGIMDIEVVLHDNDLKLIEIDARFPSQTPIAVYWSTGLNMVKILGDLFTNKNCYSLYKPNELFVSLEHIRVEGDTLAVCGEHIMSTDTPLTLSQNFFGADELLHSYQPEKRNWVATMIFTGSSDEEVRLKRKNCYANITNSSHKSFMEAKR